MEITSSVRFSTLNKQDSIKFYGVIEGVCSEWEFVIRGQWISLNCGVNPRLSRKEKLGGNLSNMFREVLDTLGGSNG